MKGGEIVDKSKLNESLELFRCEVESIIGKDEDTSLTKGEAFLLMKQVYYALDTLTDAAKEK